MANASTRTLNLTICISYIDIVSNQPSELVAKANSLLNNPPKISVNEDISWVTMAIGQPQVAVMRCLEPKGSSINFLLLFKSLA